MVQDLVFYKSPEKDKDRIIYHLQSEPLCILFEDNKCLIIDFYFYSDFSVEYRPLNKEELEMGIDPSNGQEKDHFNAHHEIYSWDFDENRNRIEDSFGVKRIIDIQGSYSPLADYKVKGFHDSYEKWISDGDSSSIIEIPAGGDYFDEVTIVLENGIEIDICPEDVDADGYHDLCIRDPNKILYFKENSALT